MYWTVACLLLFLFCLFGHSTRRRLKSAVLHNVPGPPSPSFLIGHINLVYSWDSGLEFNKKLSKTYGPVCRLKGFFGADALCVHDSRAIEYVFDEASAMFLPPPSAVEHHRLVIGEGLFTATGQRHEAQRGLLRQAFSIARLRAIVPIFNEALYKLERTLLNEVVYEPKEINIFPWVHRLVAELFTSGGLNHFSDCLDSSSPPGAYSQVMRRVGALTSLNPAFTRLVFPFSTRFVPAWFRRLIISALPSEWLRQIEQVIHVLNINANNIYKEKKQEAHEDIYIYSPEQRREDPLGVAFRINQIATGSEKLTEAELKAQINSLSFAALDTTTSALARILHLLALHPEAQTKIRNAVRAVKRRNGNCELDYYELIDLSYLDAVCRETLRLYPPLCVIERVAQRDTVIPLSRPLVGIDGQLIQSIPVTKGDHIYVNVRGWNCDPEVWGVDAWEWNPDRWLRGVLPIGSSSSGKRTNGGGPGVYSHLLTFSGGPRACIGHQMALLEMKSALVSLLDAFEFNLPLDSSDIVWKTRTKVAMPWTTSSLKRGRKRSPDPNLPLVVSIAP